MKRKIIKETLQAKHIIYFKLQYETRSGDII